MAAFAHACDRADVDKLLELVGDAACWAGRVRDGTRVLVGGRCLLQGRGTSTVHNGSGGLTRLRIVV